jgi:hypothetical protein
MLPMRMPKPMGTRRRGFEALLDGEEDEEEADGDHDAVRPV